MAVSESTVATKLAAELCKAQRPKHAVKWLTRFVHVPRNFALSRALGVTLFCSHAQMFLNIEVKCYRLTVVEISISCWVQMYQLCYAAE